MAEWTGRRFARVPSLFINSSKLEFYSVSNAGGMDGTRTRDLLRDRQAL